LIPEASGAPFGACAKLVKLSGGSELNRADSFGVLTIEGSVREFQEVNKRRRKSRDEGGGMRDERVITQ